MLQVECGNCLKTVEYDYRQVGKVILCPYCDGSLLLPKPPHRHSTPHSLNQQSSKPHRSPSQTPDVIQPKKKPTAEQQSAIPVLPEDSDDEVKFRRLISRLVIVSIGLLVVGCIVFAAVLFVLMRPETGLQPAEQPSSPTTAANDGWTPAKALELALLPILPKLQYPRMVEGTIKVYTVDLSQVNEDTQLPGHAMKLRIFLPPGEHADATLGCVIVAPAGTKLMEGIDLDRPDYLDETLPYVRDAGMVVVQYSLDNDGKVNQQQTYNKRLLQQQKNYHRFKQAGSGVVNGRNAIEFVLSKIPQVDPNRIYCAGRGSAGTLALLLAENDARIAACIAYAPISDLQMRMRDLSADADAAKAFPSLQNFLKQSSPIENVANIRCPVFLFNAIDDSNVPYPNTKRFFEFAKDANVDITFRSAQAGDHYDSIIDEGIPAGVAWLRSIDHKKKE